MDEQKETNTTPRQVVRCYGCGNEVHVKPDCPKKDIWVKQGSQEKEGYTPYALSQYGIDK